LSDGDKVMLSGYEHGHRTGNVFHAGGKPRGAGCGTCMIVSWNKPYRLCIQRSVGWSGALPCAHSRRPAHCHRLWPSRPFKKWWWDLEDEAGDGILNSWIGRMTFFPTADIEDSSRFPVSKSKTQSTSHI
jgi:hypothetical protein